VKKLLSWMFVLLFLLNGCSFSAKTSTKDDNGNVIDIKAQGSLAEGIYDYTKDYSDFVGNLPLKPISKNVRYDKKSYGNVYYDVIYEANTDKVALQITKVEVIFDAYDRYLLVHVKNNTNSTFRLVDFGVSYHDNTLVDQIPFNEGCRFSGFEFMPGQEVVADIYVSRKDATKYTIDHLHGQIGGTDQDATLYLAKKINKKNDQWFVSENSLIKAVIDSNYVLITELLRKGADVNQTDDEGATALMWAAYTGDARIAQLLIDYKADVNAVDNEGRTALMRVGDGLGLIKLGKGRMLNGPKDGYNEIVKLLIQKGANVNAKDNMGFTALMKVADCSNLEIVQALLKAGADPSARSNDGISVLEIASNGGNSEVVNILRQVGAR